MLLEALRGSLLYGPCGPVLIVGKNAQVQARSCQGLSSSAEVDSNTISLSVGDSSPLYIGSC